MIDCIIAKRKLNGNRLQNQIPTGWILKFTEGGSCSRVGRQEKAAKKKRKRNKTDRDDKNEKNIKRGHIKRPLKQQTKEEERERRDRMTG